MSATQTAERRGRLQRSARMSGDDREQALLEEGERLLGRRGLHEISVDDLARGAGLSRSAFYFYFASKEQLLLTLMERVIDEQVSAEDQTLASSAPMAEVWRQVLADSLEMWEAHRGVFQAAAQARRTHAEVGALWERLIEIFVQRATRVIEHERARGAAPATTPARELAVCLVRMNERVFEALTQDPGGSGSDPEQRRRTVDAVVAVWLAAVYGTAPT